MIVLHITTLNAISSHSSSSPATAQTWPDKPLKRERGASGMSHSSSTSITFYQFCLIAGAADSVCHLQPEEDHYRLVLDRSDSETTSNNYFRSRRASQILHLDRSNPLFLDIAGTL